MVSTVQAQRTLFPFRGLRSFTKDESELFFGREGQSDELAKRLGQKRFVAVVGTSGSGKSSLVRAGLLPCLDSGCLVKCGSDWRIADMRPGGRPIDQLAAALDRAQISETPVDQERLRSSSLALIGIAQSSYSTNRLQADENLLILVDQFEELFRYQARDNSMQDRDEKAAFVKLLIEAARQRDLPIYVAITMRSEFLGDCARFRDLPEAINAGQYLIPRMSREQRRQAIEGPIRMAGGDISPRLVQRILNEVGEDPGQLPVMQHALLRTWIHWTNEDEPQRPLDFEDYEAVGTLEKAVSNHADEVAEEARSKNPERGAAIVKRLFQRLSDRDQFGRETRRPTSMQELAEVCEAPLSEIAVAVDCFRGEGRNFLSTMDEQLTPSAEVDVTHESLLTKWDRLSKDWNPEEEESRRTYLRISARAQDALSDRPSAVAKSASAPHFREYLTGVGLARSLAWWNQRQPNAAWARRYIREDQKLLDSDAIDSQFLLAHRYLLESKKQAVTARYRRFMSVLSVAGLAVVAIAVWIYRQNYETATAKALLMQAELASSLVPSLPGTSKDDPRASAFRAAESLQHQNSLEAQTILTQALFQLPQSLQTIQGRKAFDVGFSPDGTWLAIAGQDGVDLYDAKKGVKSRNFEFEGKPIGTPKLLFPANGVFMVAVEKKISIWVFDQGDWKAAADLQCGNTVNRFAADASGGLLVAECGALHFWTPSSSKSVSLEPDCASTLAMTLSSDGTRVAYVCQTAQGWTIRSREVTRDGQGHVSGISDPIVRLALGQEESNKAAISSDAKASPDKTKKEPYDSAETWSSPKEVRNLRFDPAHSDVLVIAGSDGTVRSWRAWSPSRTTKQTAASTWTKGRGYAAENPAVERSSTALYRPAEGYKLLTMRASAEIISFSEDGSWIAVADSHGVAKVWDTTEISRERLIAHLALDHNMKSIAVSRAGRHIAAVTADGFVHLWRLDGKRGDFSDWSRVQSHGSYVITRPVSEYAFGGASSIIDTRTGDVVGTFPDYHSEGDRSYRPLAISSDGTVIAGVARDSVTVNEFHLVVNEFRDGKIGKKKWQGKLPEGNIYLTSFGFSPDNHYFIGPFGDHDKIWLAAWDVSRPGVPVRNISAGVGDSYEFLGGTSQLYIANPKSRLRIYDVASDRSMPVTWSRQSFANIGFTPDGRTAIGVEVNKGCDSTPEAGREPGSTVSILHVANGEESSHFEIGNYCVQSFEVSRDSRYLLTTASTRSDLDHPRVLQLWDLASSPPTQKAEIRNGAPILDAGITPDLNITLLDRKRFAVTPWQPEGLQGEFCARVTPNESEKKVYSQLCSGQSHLRAW